jgi:hypothetical protein
LFATSSSLAHPSVAKVLQQNHIFTRSTSNSELFRSLTSSADLQLEFFFIGLI